GSPRRADLRVRRRRRGWALRGLERARAMDDPDVLLRVDGHADRLSENPLVRQRLRPQRIDLEPRCRDAAFELRVGEALEVRRTRAERREQYEQSDADAERFHALPPGREIRLRRRSVAWR